MRPLRPPARRRSAGAPLRVLASALALGLGLVGATSTARAQQYRFPGDDADYGFFYPTAYVDHGGVDWNCGDIRYDGHRGSDFGGGSWAGMAAGRHIVAAAEGVVTATHDGEADQCSTGDCPGGGGYGNHVWLRHPDGKATVYGHLKTGSVLVAPGDYVACGAALGQMGSSGFSTGPHLHFGVRSADDVFEDPFLGSCSAPPSYWVEQGAYAELPGTACDGPAPPCAALELVGCGAVLGSRNDAAGSTDLHGYYGCGLDWAYSGREIAWRFATDRDEPVDVALTGLSADLSLHVLASDACDTRDCVGYSDGSASSDEAATFAAVAGHTYVIVVDGWQGATSDFTLTVSCTGSLPAAGGSGGGGSGGAGTGGAGSGLGGAGGAPPSGGAPGTGGAEASEARAGCGCVLPAGARRDGAGLVGLAALAALAWRRRRHGHAAARVGGVPAHGRAS
ncbi:MAG: peptidoglycan DD-metalloendopeptidase family protein [Myxococcales bacterium]|nr:peptidoglycan DD-metalloendopeptidase family protein [Myxococcales bacterium]